MWYAIEFFKEITLMNKELEYKTVNVDEFVKLCKAGEVYGIFGDLNTIDWNRFDCLELSEEFLKYRTEESLDAYERYELKCKLSGVNLHNSVISGVFFDTEYKKFNNKLFNRFRIRKNNKGSYEFGIKNSNIYLYGNSISIGSRVSHKFSDTLRDIYLRTILPQVFDNMVFCLGKWCFMIVFEDCLALFPVEEFFNGRYKEILVDRNGVREL